MAARLHRPLGLVLAEREGGEGVLVESLVPGGNGEKGGVQAGDWLLSVDGADVAYSTFDEALDALAAGAPAAAALELERTVISSVETDAATGAAAYWAAKRATRAQPAAVARNTVDGLASHKDVRLKGGALGGGSFGAVFEAEWAGRALVAKRANGAFALWISRHACALLTARYIHSATLQSGSSAPWSAWRRSCG